MPVRGQKALEPQRDLAMATSDDHAHPGEAIAKSSSLPACRPARAPTATR
jgi:hypothetical protein